MERERHTQRKSEGEREKDIVRELTFLRYFRELFFDCQRQSFFRKLIVAIHQQLETQLDIFLQQQVSQITAAVAIIGWNAVRLATAARVG